MKSIIVTKARITQGPSRTANFGHWNLIPAMSFPYTQYIHKHRGRSSIRNSLISHFSPSHSLTADEMTIIKNLKKTRAVTRHSFNILERNFCSKFLRELIPLTIIASFNLPTKNCSVIFPASSTIFKQCQKLRDRHKVKKKNYENNIEEIK